MGNLYSHLPVVNVSEYEEVKEEDPTVMARTPVPDITGKSKNLTALIDPRSPTVGVSRTPVEVVAERERTRRERMQRLQALDANEVTKGTGTTGGLTITTATTDKDEPLTPSAFIDPRSPTFEYKRTPLALGEGKSNTCREIAETGKGPQGVEDSGLIAFIDESQTPEKKVYDNELQAPVVASTGKMCQDLRKRLFVDKLNETRAAEGEVENKEN